VAADEGEVGWVPEAFSDEGFDVVGDVFSTRYAVGDGLLDDSGRDTD
jgi:hypothetical protein